MDSRFKGHLNKAQIDIITKTIVAQYRMYVKYTSTPEFQNLFADEYAPHKHQHTVSWAISSAFPSGGQIADLYISRLTYGKGHKRPILSNDFVELLILNKTTDFDSDYLLERYRYNENVKSKKIFAFIKFDVSNKALTRIALCLPDAHGKIISEEILLDRKQIFTLAA